MAEYNGVRIEIIKLNNLFSGVQAVLPYWLCLQNSAMLHYAQMQHTW